MCFLSEIDPPLKKVIDIIGSMKIELDPLETVFEALGSSILYQQLHGKAAAKILERLKLLFGSSSAFPQPAQIIQSSEEELRSVGLSRAKVAALKDLAEKAIARLIPNRAQAETMSDIELITAFSQVRGIGRWTAEMFLIFSLGRLDVLPSHDFGVRKGFMKVYALDDMPTPKELEQYGERWSPFRTAASWYLWRALEIDAS
ncbi:DNA-3-methyladenine glycosylase [Legionella fallonii LLAP-10]|uniref:DNA-3-methyladenine glycosylase II n=2 Tax=Legionella fallonii TaxID=96230 RepID=A0A098G9W9_9GAMM|nr:DNA-3-methyladenine glycosylase [Legionella fallonii LLAP-10]